VNIEALRYMNKTELQREAARRGLDASGTRPILIDRITAAMTSTDAGVDTPAVDSAPEGAGPEDVDPEDVDLEDVDPEDVTAGDSEDLDVQRFEIISGGRECRTTYPLTPTSFRRGCLDEETRKALFARAVDDAAAAGITAHRPRLAGVALDVAHVILAIPRAARRP
jgi:hypothetical protein